MQQLATQGWTVIDQGAGVPQDAAPSLRNNVRGWLAGMLTQANLLQILRTSTVFMDTDSGPRIKAVP